jgi:putative methyltransferase (TIGR04325 family)
MLSMIRIVLKKILPPIFIDIINIFRKKESNNNIQWKGDYKSWKEAMLDCSGYDSPNILEKCKVSVLKVKNGEVAYERDSVTFVDIQYSFPLLAGLQRAALENSGKLSVIDFGGSLGSSYFQNKDFLSSTKQLNWSVIEQNEFVQCGKENFEDDKISFYYSIEECLKHQTPNVIILSSVLQYLENPFKWIDTFKELDIEYIIVDRTSFVDHDNDILTVQNIPLSIYEASYPCWFFHLEKFKEKFKEKYSEIASFNSFADTNIIFIAENKKAYWKGFLFKKNKSVC